MIFPAIPRFSRLGRRVVSWTPCILGLLDPISAACQDVVPLPAEDVPVAVMARDLFVVGSTFGESWEAFSDLTTADLGFDEAGNLYILDRTQRQVVSVDRTGKLRYTAGRVGDGPGEFSRPRAIAVRRDGTFSIYDRGHAALIHFDETGAYSEQQRLSMSVVPGAVIRGGASGSTLSVGGPTHLVTAMGEPAVRGPLRSYPRGGSSVRPHILHDAGSRAGIFPFNADEIASQGAARKSLGRFAPRASFGVTSDGGVVLAFELPYRVRILDATGDSTIVLSRDLPLRPVTDEDEAREKRHQLAALENDHRPRAMVGPGGEAVEASDLYRRLRRTAIESMSFSDFFPSIKRLAVDMDDRIWIERTGDDPHGAGPVDIIESDYGYAGTIPSGTFDFPAALGPDGLAAFIETDAFDVPAIRVVQLSVVPR